MRIVKNKRTTRNQWKLDAYKETIALKRSSGIAQDYHSVITLATNITLKYNMLLAKFLKENQIKQDNIQEEIKSNANDSTLKNLTFITMIPKVIETHHGNGVVDYEFLEKKFKKIEDNQKALELKNALKKSDQQFTPANSNPSSSVPNLNNSTKFNLSDLYRFGEFILNFLTDEEVRANVFFDLLILIDEYDDIFIEKLNNSFIQQQISSNKILKSWIISDQQI